jgi:hypothetical protein
MKRISTVFISILFACLSFAQSQQMIIKNQASDMVKALLRKDFTTFTKYMHPKVIDMAGGKEKLLKRMDTANTLVTEFGAKITKVVIGNPGKIVKFKNELQTTLPETTDLQTPLGNVTIETTLIAISTDAGKTWYFIDTSVYNINQIKKTLPDLSPELVIPPQKEPKFSTSE